MIGAIFGDIAGSVYEFNNTHNYNFRLLTKDSEPTDDTYMTLAVAKALMETSGQDDETIRTALVKQMQKMGRKHPDAGYGGMFYRWLQEKNPEPYNSFGNGSAMRVSSAGWLYDTEKEVLHFAKLTAEVTHNHPEGIKGAQAIAMAIFMARNGKDKTEIKDFIESHFQYNLDCSLQEIQKTYTFDETCQGSVPEAIIAFLESENFEDAVRNAVSLGGDTDTLAAITGSIAEAFYDMSAILRAECRNRVSEDILHVMQLFDETIGRRVYNSDEYEDLSGNAAIETAIHQMYAKDDKNSLLFLLTMLCGRMKSKGHVLVPFVTVGEDMFSDLDVYHLKEGDTLTLDHDVRLHMDTVTEGKDEEWFYFFTGEEESRRKQCGNVIMSIPLCDIMEIAYKSEKVQGVVINPFGKYVRLTKELLGFILKEFTENWQED